MKQYEDILEKNGIKVDGSPKASSRLSDSRDETAALAPLKATSSDTKARQENYASQSGRLLVQEGKPRYVENNLWESLNEFHVGQESEGGGSESETRPTPYTTAAADGIDLILGTPLASAATSGLHPKPMLMNKLWKIFRQSVDPLVKLFHVPTVHKVFDQAAQDMSTISSANEALMFAIYACAIMSLTEAECKTLTGEEKTLMLARYHYGTRQFLMKADLLNSSDLVPLQALELFLVSVQLLMTNAGSKG